ncbi:MAG: hypothetical protein Q9159_006701 [Coniocarpon cinnabarinum]
MPFESIVNKLKGHHETVFEVRTDFEDGLTRTEYTLEAPPNSQVPPPEWKKTLDLLMGHFGVGDTETETKGQTYTVKAKSMKSYSTDKFIEMLKAAGMKDHRLYRSITSMGQ